MLAVFASLLAVAAAAPQYPLYYQPYVYPHQYMQYPLYRSGYFPIASVPADDTQLVASTRGIFGIGSSQEEKGTLSLSTANSYTVEGTVNFYQNIFTGSNSKFKAYLKGTDMQGKEYTVGLADSCTGTVTTLATVKAPAFLINGFYYGPQTVSSFNIDGTDGKTDLTGKYFVVKDSTSTVVGCSTALAA